jgi:hypothetical protein
MIYYTKEEWAREIARFYSEIRAAYLTNVPFKDIVAPLINRFHEDGVHGFVCEQANLAVGEYVFMEPENNPTEVLINDLFGSASVKTFILGQWVQTIISGKTLAWLDNSEPGGEPDPDPEHLAMLAHHAQKDD